MMRRFRDGEVDVLVATTVIEVGIDVPNATIMVVEHPERFGLAQLHQLRGRIGRGDEESYCILLSDGGAPDRLQAFAATHGRLQDRGAGPGGARHGRPDRRAAVGGFELRHARLPADTDLLSRARELATELIGADPALQRAEHQRTAGAGGVAVSEGGGVVPGGLSWRSCRSQNPIRTPTPVACRRLRTSGSKGMLSGFGACRVSSQTNIARGAHQGGLAAEQPAAGLPVVVERRLVQLLDLGVGVAARRRRARTARGRRSSADSSASKLLVRVVVGAGGEQVHADRPRGQHPFPVLDQRTRAAGARAAGAAASRTGRAPARSRGSSAVPVEVALAADGDDARRPAPPGRARPAATAGAATPRSRRVERAERAIGAAEQDLAVQDRDRRRHRPVELHHRLGPAALSRARCGRACRAGSPRTACRPAPPASRGPARPAPRSSGAGGRPGRRRPPASRWSRPRAVRGARARVTRSRPATGRGERPCRRAR